MKKLSLVVATLLFATNVVAESNSHWGYSGDTGPDNWATLTADNFACTGQKQSPVNLTGFIEADLTPIKFDYLQDGHEVINNGHTIQLNYKSGSSITLDGQQFKLLQAHFHAPSENHINGKSYPLEAHLVHVNEQGGLAVVAVLFEQGALNKGLEVQTDKYGSRLVVATPSPNKWLKNIWSVMPSEAGQTHSLTEMVNVADILPRSHDYYSFDGSLTTPPCSEGVKWLVMKEIVTISKKQIETFKKVLHEPNNRPIQALNSRPIYQ